MKLSIPPLLLLFLLQSLFIPSGKAQFGFLYNDSIPVIKSGNLLDFPWAGGLNHAQFSSIDIDFNGHDDLFIFDRSANQIRMFKTVIENGIKGYEFLYDSRNLFPEDIRYKAAMVDYNADGKKDIFTYGLGGVKVLKNIGNATNGLQWELVSEQLQSIYSNNSYSNLYISSTDIPAFVDVDGDGDIDVLTFNIGGQRVEYHKNTSMEKYGTPDSLEFELVDACWGKFIESDVNNNIQLNATSGPCDSSGMPVPENSPRHSGSCLLALDLNDDQAMDLILGDVSHYNLTALINGNTQAEPALMISQDEHFPSNTTPVNIPTFPASFYVDVNHDGIKDLIVSTNENGQSENLESVWYYKNEGTNTFPNFSFQKKNFLQDQMIDNGKGAIPILVDLNQDGLKDLLIASYYRYLDPSDKISKIQYYQNTGTTESPEFTFVSDDWLSLSNTGYGLRMHPTFGDLSGNGDKEMIIGTANGKLHLYTKTGTGPEDFTLTEAEMKDHQGQTIQVGAFASPQLFDLNNNGLLDLIIGQKSAGLTYYKNTGTTTQASFELITEDLGAIDMGEPFTPDNYAVPAFVRHNDTTHLFIGNRKGTIFYYGDIENNLADGDSFTLLSDHYAFIETGAYSAPCIDQLRSDGRYEMFVGTDLGGVWAYIAELSSDPILTAKDIKDIGNHLEIYPNPSKTGVFIIESKSKNQQLTVEIFDYLGRNIKKEKSNLSTIQLDLSFASKGVYTVIIKSRSQVVSTRKIVIE